MRREHTTTTLALDVVIVLALVGLAIQRLARVGGVCEVGSVGASRGDAQAVDKADHPLLLVRLAVHGQRVVVISAAHPVQGLHQAFGHHALGLGGRRQRVSGRP